MAIVNGYVTLPELKRWLRYEEPEDAQPDDELYEATATAVSRYVDNYCNRHFYQITEERDFCASDVHTIALGTFNDLVSITELSTDEDGDGVFAEVWDAADYETRPKNTLGPYRFIRAIGRRFPRNTAAGGRLERIRVEGVWGWPTVPEAVHQATLIQAARVAKRKEAPEGILGLNQFGVLRVSGKPDPDVRDLLGSYRIRAVG